MKDKTSFTRRRQRIRARLKRAGETGKGRLRLSVFRSAKHISVQVIDDGKGVTIAAASSQDKDLRGKLKSGASRAAAQAVGRLAAERAVKAGVKQVVFDRGGYLYHGRVKALADGVREGGLEF